MISKLSAALALVLGGAFGSAFFASSASASETGSSPAIVSQSALCVKWDVPKKVGDLNSKVINESSGMARSKKYDVIYHTNDSGTPPIFFVSKLDGSAEKVVKIKDFKPIDPEEIGLGPCPKDSKATCVVVADIGDNLEKRDSVALFFVEEIAEFGEAVSPVMTVRFKYPDHPHNSEAMAVLPNGDVVFVTKEMSKLGQTSPALLYRAKKSDYENSKGKPVTLKKFGEIDIVSLTKQLGFGALVTAMTVTSDAKRFALLTYAMGIEFQFDLSSGEFPPTKDLKEGVHYRLIPLAPLPQQESIAYDKNDRDLFYSTEILQRLLGIGAPAPLMKVTCVDPQS